MEWLWNSQTDNPEIRRLEPFSGYAIGRKALANVRGPRQWPARATLGTRLSRQKLYGEHRSPGEHLLARTEFSNNTRKRRPDGGSGLNL
jgi:hypothetical protein